MTDWLNDATEKWDSFSYYHMYYAGRQIPGQELADNMFEALDDAYENNERMARVSRELAKYISELWKEVGAHPEYKTLSDDAKELLK